MKTLREQYAELREQALAIPAAAEADGRKELNDEEQAKVAVLLKDAVDLADKIKQADASDEQLAQIAALPEFKAAGHAATDAAAAGTAVAAATRERVKSLGERFVESEQYGALKARYPGGHIPERTKVQMDPVPIGGFARASEGRKDLVFVGDNTNDDSQIPAVPVDFRGIIMPTFAPLTVRQLVSSGTTTSDEVQYTREIRESRDLAAAPVAEARQSAKSGDEDSVKPESTFKYERASTTVKTVAHHIPVTTKALADVGQVRTLIDVFLRRGLDEELEHQLVNGDGVGENLLGIGNDPDLTEVVFDTDIITTARHAKKELNVLGVNPTAWLIHPDDDEAIDLLKDQNDRFYGNGPFALGPNNLWSIPRVWSNECTPGQAFLGDFGTAVLYDREAASIQTGTIDDQFIRNMLTVLAEVRVAFAVWEPFKIATVDLGTESS